MFSNWVRQLIYTSLLLIIKLRFTCHERKFTQPSKSRKYYDHDFSNMLRKLRVRQENGFLVKKCTTLINFLFLKSLLSNSSGQASFLRYLTSFLYCLWLLVLRPHVYCLSSALFCHMQPSYDFITSAVVPIIITSLPQPSTATSTFYSNILRQSLWLWWLQSFLVTC